MCTVVNLYKEDYDLYIGRSRWGQPYNKWCNPFKLKKGEDPGATIEKYRRHLWSQIKKGEITISELKSLNGKKLGCFCKPKPCHGDIIVKAVQWALTQE